MNKTSRFALLHTYLLLHIHHFYIKFSLEPSLERERNKNKTPDKLSC